MSVNAKWLLGLAGGVVGYFAATGWLMFIVVMMVIYDSYTAWELSFRVKKRFPNLGDGKFKSNAALKAIRKIRDYCIVIVLTFLIEDKIIIMFDFYLPYIVSGVLVFVEAWSILENKSSCSGSKWAQVLQRVMVDKTARHFNLNSDELSAILKGEKYEKQVNNNSIPAGNSSPGIMSGEAAAEG